MTTRVVDGGSRSASHSVLPWLLAVIAAAAIVFGLYVWGSPTKVSPTQVTQAVPAGAGRRLPMPQANPPGWHVVFRDDFNGRKVNRAKWRVYSGQPGGDPAAWWLPSHLRLSNGMLIISGYRDPAGRGRWTTGGISSSQSFSQTYGKYLVRFRLDRGVGIGHAVLLFPQSGRWPPEIDFSEDGGRSRAGTLGSLHYSAGNKLISKWTPVYTTQWHTLGVEWTRQTLRFSLDGRFWYTIKRNVVPSIPMALAIQTQTWPCAAAWGTCPDASTPRVVRMYVDWAVAYAPDRR